MDDLIANIDALHTTNKGAWRVARNLHLGKRVDVVAHCRAQITRFDVQIIRRGKNLYVSTAGIVITINASTFTIITAHRVGSIRGSDNT